MTIVSDSAGAYLYVCVNWFHVHYDEGFSSLRIPHFKGFSRLHITSQARRLRCSLSAVQWSA